MIQTAAQISQTKRNISLVDFLWKLIKLPRRVSFKNLLHFISFCYRTHLCIIDIKFSNFQHFPKVCISFRYCYCCAYTMSIIAVVFTSYYYFWFFFFCWLYFCYRSNSIISTSVINKAAQIYTKKIKSERERQLFNKVWYCEKKFFPSLCVESH